MARKAETPATEQPKEELVIEQPAESIPAAEEAAEEQKTEELAAPTAEQPTATDAEPAPQSSQGVRDLPRLMTRIFGTPLLMSAAKIDVILGALGPRLGLSQAMFDGERAKAFFDNGADDGTDDQKPYDVTTDGLAVIGIDGTLVYKTSWLGALSGLTGYGDIKASFDMAVADSSVRGILLQIDSYGGEVNGCFDLSDAIFAARAKKPVYAVAADDAYSAAYALAASASKLFVSRTSGVGSIGVVALHIDQSAADKADGLKFTYVKAGDKKTDGNPHEPLSASAKTSIQAECDRLWELFASSVARYRGLSVDAIKAMEAGCFFGEQAVGAKLADAVGTPDDAMAALRGELARATPADASTISMESPKVATTDAPQAVPPTVAAIDNVVDLSAAREKMHGEITANVTEIVELCALAGRPQLAGDFLRRKLGTDLVRKELQTLRAQASDAQGVRGHIMPDAGGTESQQIASMWDRAFAAASGQNKEK